MNKKFTTLMYHNIKSEGDKFTVTKKQFLEQLSVINKKDEKLFSLEKITFDDFGNIITFDDGFKSDLWAAKKLSEFGFTATFFVVKDYALSNNSYLSENEILEISELGHEIGVHGKSHAWWTSLNEKTLIDDLSETKSWIESLISKDVISCSAPGGKINNNVIKNLITSNLFKYIRISKPGLNYLDDKLIHSVPIYRSTNIEQYIKIINHNKSYFFKQKSIFLLKNQIKNLLDR